MEFGIADPAHYKGRLGKAFLTFVCRVNLVKRFYARKHAHEYFTKVTGNMASVCVSFSVLR